MYWMQVLDQRVCPIHQLSVVASATDWDPTPTWAPGDTFLFLVNRERREAVFNGQLVIPASADSCRSEVDRIERSEIPLVAEEGGLSADTVIFGPPDAGHPDTDGSRVLVATGSNPEVRATVPDDQSERVITWGEIVTARGNPAAIGINYADHDNACGAVPLREQVLPSSPGSQCRYDSDCAICHDGSNCGSVITRDLLIERGADCQLPDAAECESYRARCCGGRCRPRPY